MNIALEKTQEYVDGKARRNYGDAFVRGNNGMCISLAHRFPAALLYFLLLPAPSLCCRWGGSIVSCVRLEQ